MKIRPLILLPFLFLLPACQPVVELDNEKLLPVDAPIGPKTTSPGTTPEESTDNNSSTNPSTPSSPKTTATEPKTPSGPPDWKKRYKELMAEVDKKFAIPASDRPIPIEMKDGRTRQGNLLGVSGDKATFRIPIPGKEPATATVERQNLSDKTRRLIWVQEAAPYYAQIQLRKEKAAYDKANPPEIASANQPEHSTTRIENTRPQKPPRQGPGMITPSSKPLKVESDGSLRVVKTWLRSNISSPESIRIHKWTSLERDTRPDVKGYTIDVIFSSNAGSLGTIRQHKRFFLNNSGGITNTGNIRQ